MTKSTITREQLLEIIETDHVQCGEASYLASMALAAMDSEPVILYRERNPYNGLTTGWQELTENEFSFLKENAGENAEFLTLYRHAQPAPVVPELRVDWQESEFSAGWNACRAAMLAAAPQSTGSEPATVPGKWIPVSERVPTKQDGSVFLTWNGQYIGKELFLMGSFQCLKPEIITHWMPLPAAPQEVK
ncbi:TPA: DUF551 domain-containing protein [Klebsiella pneumoniae]|nr:DUF551 domain-containing protein [Klebsiella pneumoniae]WRS17311.1 DUF551 domain-containing protein [Klebsiella pneumoniae]